ncbi:MAG: hypothetical protein AB1630_08510 [bacterium]
MAYQFGDLRNLADLEIGNVALKELPRLLERDFALIVKDRLIRKYVVGNKGRYVKANIIGEATRDEKHFTIIGEAKYRFLKKDIDNFMKKLKRLNGVFDEIFPLLVSHRPIKPYLNEYVKKEKIALYYTYDFHAS